MENLWVLYAIIAAIILFLGIAVYQLYNLWRKYMSAEGKKALENLKKYRTDG